MNNIRSFITRQNLLISNPPLYISVTHYIVHILVDLGCLYWEKFKLLRSKEILNNFWRIITYQDIESIIHDTVCTPGLSNVIKSSLPAVSNNKKVLPRNNKREENQKVFQLGKILFHNTNSDLDLWTTNCGSNIDNLATLSLGY